MQLVFWYFSIIHKEYEHHRSTKNEAIKGSESNDFQNASYIDILGHLLSLEKNI